MLGLIQIMARSQICFAEQAIDLSRVKAFGVLVIESRLHLAQEFERLSVRLVFYACIRQQSQRVRVK